MPTAECVTIRRAKLTDAPFIRSLALRSVVFGIPDGRDVSDDVVVERAEASLESLEVLLHRRREAAILVAVDASKQETPVGYLILHFNRSESSTGDAQSFIYDIAVEPAYMGTFVAHRMVREAARISHENGYRFMAATVSASNQRALLSAIKLGFDVERIGLVTACGPAGLEPMPGRTPQSRAHAVDRARRQSQRRKGHDISAV